MMYSIDKQISDVFYNPLICKNLNFFIDSNKLLFKITSSDDTFLENIDFIPECLTIGECLFKENKFIKSVIIPEGVVKIMDYAFIDCTSLEKVILPESLIEIGDHVFQNCRSLKQINFPNCIEKIGRFSFKRTLIEEAILPHSLKEIGDGCFNKCENLRKIKISNDNVKIGNMVFNGSMNLKDVECPENNTLKRKIRLELLNV